MLLLVKDLGRVMALNRRRHIILPPSPQRLKQRKGKSREKRGKEEARSFWKQKKKSMPYFPFSERSPPWWGLWAGHMWYSPTGNIPWNATSVYLKDRQGMLAQPLQGETVSPGKPRRSSGTSAPEGEGTYNCLIGQYLITNGLFGTVIDVAVSNVFGWIWPHPLACNGSGL